MATVARRRSHARHVRLPAAAVAALVLAACGESTGPGAPAPLAVAFLDAGGRLNTVRTGEDRVVTAIAGGIPYASTRGAVALHGDGLRIYHVAEGTVDTLPVANFGYRTAGAISPDGSRLAYATRAGTATGSEVYLVMVHLASGAADSVRVSGRQEVLAAEQIEFSTPIYSPSGDSIAFLLPNQIGMQLFLYEVPTGRMEVQLLRVQVSTFFQPLGGWPRWTPQATIRFLTRLRIEGALTDTLVVLEVSPRDPEAFARAVYLGAPPDGLPLANPGVYSFDAEGRAVAFATSVDGQTGIFALRQGQPTFETLVQEPGLFPRYPILIP
jgi:hypothetical protein